MNDNTNAPVTAQQQGNPTVAATAPANVSPVTAQQQTNAVPQPQLFAGKYKTPQDLESGYNASRQQYTKLESEHNALRTELETLKSNPIDFTPLDAYEKEKLDSVYMPLIESGTLGKETYDTFYNSLGNKAVIQACKEAGLTKNQMEKFLPTLLHGLANEHTETVTAIKESYTPETINKFNYIANIINNGNVSESDKQFVSRFVFQGATPEAVDSFYDMLSSRYGNNFAVPDMPSEGNPDAGAAKDYEADVTSYWDFVNTKYNGDVGRASTDPAYEAIATRYYRVLQMRGR